MPLLELDSVSLFVSGKPLIADANLTVNRGDRMGIIGRNGTGKSHLMELMAGNIPADAGKRKVAGNTSVLLVKQELPDDDQTPLDYLRSADPDIQRLEAALEEADESNIGEISGELVELEEERYEKSAPIVLKGLGLKEEELGQPMRFLSGGLRMRIGLAMALIRTPDVLLLDEPTNHLDLESTQWLIAFLQNYPPSAAFVIVTHDVKLLMDVCRSTVHLRGGILTEFDGQYESYRKHLDTQKEKDVQRNTDLERKIGKKKDLYYRFRDLPESRAAQAVAQLKAAKKLEERLVDIVQEEPVVELEFPTPAQLPDPVIRLNKASAGYGGRIILSGLDLSIQYGAKIGLLGRNGEGKSTLIKLFAQKMEPCKGMVERCPRLSIGYFSQDLSDELDPHLTVYQQYFTKTGVKNDAEIRSYLGRYGFSHEHIGTKIEDLSGGEKSRLLFALICAAKPGLIILDEPTNHLDVETRAELVKAISNYEGSVVLVSHDWDLHEKTMTTFWLAQEGTVKVYEKSLQHYQRELQRFIDVNGQCHGGKVKTTGEVDVSRPPAAAAKRKETRDTGGAAAAAVPQKFFQPQPGTKDTAAKGKPKDKLALTDTVSRFG